MLDIQDWLPYILSIMLIIVLTCSFIVHLYYEVTHVWRLSGRLLNQHFFPLILSIAGHATPLRLSRMIRRKEGPDDDGSDCFFLLIYNQYNQLGGRKWTYSRDSQRGKRDVCMV